MRVRAPGEAGTDPYKPTPDELFARGKAHFDAGRLAEAGEALEPLFAGYTLRDDVAKDAARMLLLINIQENQPRKIVTYFEVVKEKAPELILTFDQLMAIGRAYREINEYERAMIVWRGLIEASYLEDARVGELLRQRGKTLEAIAYLVELWRSYPNTASIESDFFGLSQVVAQTASRAVHRPAAAPRAGRRRDHPVRADAPDDPHDPGLPVAVAQESRGRRGQPGPRRRLHRPGGFQGRRPAGRLGSPSCIPRARTSTASSTAKRSPTSI